MSNEHPIAIELRRMADEQWSLNSYSRDFLRKAAKAIDDVQAAQQSAPAAQAAPLSREALVQNVKDSLQALRDHDEPKRVEAMLTDAREAVRPIVERERANEFSAFSASMLAAPAPTASPAEPFKACYGCSSPSICARNNRCLSVYLPATAEEPAPPPQTAESAKEAPADALEALRELVRLKDLKEAAELVNTSGSATATVRKREMLNEYERCKPIAWANARAALAKPQEDH